MKVTSRQINSPEERGAWTWHRRVARGIALCVPALVALVLAFLFLSPKPFLSVALRGRDVRAIPAGYSPPDGFEEITRQSILHADNAYQSTYGNSTYDVYLPAGAQSPAVLLFIHGGGFILGDKQMAAYYGPALAAEGYAVIAVNYALAPDGTLDDQTRQMIDFFRDYPRIALQFGLDAGNTFACGSSAGAYLAARAVTALHSPAYAATLELDALPAVDIRGLILYSAPYEISAIQEARPGGALQRLALFEAGWAITGNRAWRGDAGLREAYDLYGHITPDMPPMFISDGNHNTFTAQAKRYAQAARTAGLAVTELFFDSGGEVGHGFQMDMRTPAAQTAFAEMLAFMAEHRR